MLLLLLFISTSAATDDFIPFVRIVYQVTESAPASFAEERYSTTISTSGRSRS